MNDKTDKEVQEKLDMVLKSEQFWNKYIFQLIAIVFIAGGGWMTLSNVQALAEDNKDAIQEQERENDLITEKLARIEVTQQHIKDELDEQKELTKEVLEAIKELKEAQD